MILRTGVIIVAGGRGRRMGGDLPKQFRLLGGLPVLARTIHAFAAALPCAPIVAVLPAEHIAFWQNLAARFDVARHTVVAGGDERFFSVRRGLAALPKDVELIAVHDGVRPLLTSALIRRTTEAAAVHGAAIPVVAPADSFRVTDGTSSRPADRNRLRAVQTPQVFAASLLRRAYETEFSPAFTDDASVVDATSQPIFLCEGERRNFKITSREDMLFAEALLAADEALGSETETPPSADRIINSDAGSSPASDEAGTPETGIRVAQDATNRPEQGSGPTPPQQPLPEGDIQPTETRAPSTDAFDGGAGAIR